MQNLQQLFSNSELPSSPKTHSLLKGQLTLFRRPNSNNWQCRFKLPTGQWHVASTGSDILDQARQQAIAIHALVQARIQQGLAVQSRTFAQIAYEELDAMDRKVGSGEGKMVLLPSLVMLRAMPSGFILLSKSRIRHPRPWLIWP